MNNISFENFVFTLSDLLLAYRKAKSDCFYARTFPTALKFALYEEDLINNLKALLEVLNKGNFETDIKYLGEFRLFPKKLSLKDKEKSKGHIYFSDANKSFEHVKLQNELISEFRVIGDFPVDTHIISALWINKIGHKFDAGLQDSCRAMRLKRIGDVYNEDDNDEKDSDFDGSKIFHKSAIGSFPPYIFAYKKWRDDGLKVIRTELNNKRDIIAVSIDLTSYYHLLDPLAINNKELHKSLNVVLEPQEIKFNTQMAIFLSEWSKKAKELFKTENGGLVIGLSASPIIANMVLNKWDKEIHEKITPIYYGRYVDDMFLVIHDPHNIKTINDFMQILKSKLGENIFDNNNNDNIWFIEQSKEFQGESKIQLQQEKQRIFILSGQSGLDFIDSIEKEIHDLSSEYRMMPDPAELTNTTASKVLKATSLTKEKADTLRKADGLTIQRLGWSLQLRHIRTLTKDLPPKEWEEARQEFYEFVYNHILQPENLFLHFSYLMIVLGLMIELKETIDEKKFIKKLDQNIDKILDNSENKIQTIFINGYEIDSDKIDIEEYIKKPLKDTINIMIGDCYIRYSENNSYIKNNKRVKEYLNTQDQSENIENIIELVLNADLANTTYLKTFENKERKQKTKEQEQEQEQEQKNSDFIKILTEENNSHFLKTIHCKDIETAIEKCGFRNYSILPFIFPTRPLSTEKIFEKIYEDRMSETHLDKFIDDWKNYVKTFRGVWVKSKLEKITESDEKTKIIRINLSTEKEKQEKFKIALSNLKTTDDDWLKTGAGKSNLTLKRYKTISHLVNQALKLTPRPDYLLFPELSIPIPWIDSISSRLSKSKISLIAGTEYKHTEKEIYSESCLVLTSNLLGFPTTVKILQPKIEPAIEEDKKLLSLHGKKWKEFNIDTKDKITVYTHNNFYFGVMVCSELQNTKRRSEFQGNVDALIVLSWNKDLETFSSLVEASALDVHAFTILVNNREYGDSRIRVPAKKPHKRDLVRIKGGEDDFIVSAEINVKPLREFQSRFKRWTDETNEFKPVPEGFTIYKNRKVNPK